MQACARKAVDEHPARPLVVLLPRGPDGVLTICGRYRNLFDYQTEIAVES